MSERVTGYKTYRTSSGDTFDSLSLAMYGDEKMSHRIIRFNPDYADVLVFDSGVTLRLPIVDSATAPASLAPWRR